jgi:hypothetical protein
MRRPLSGLSPCDSGSLVTGLGRLAGERTAWDVLRATCLTAALLGVPLFVGGVSGCAGRTFDGQVYRGDDVSFRLGPIPASARQVEASDALVAFRDDEAGSTIAVSARCGQDSDDVPLRALVQHLFLHFTERRTIAEKEFTLVHRAALEAELEAALDGVSSHFVVVVLKHDGCVYDFVHVDGGGDSPAIERSRTDFRAMVRGFEVLR